MPKINNTPKPSAFAVLIAFSIMIGLPIYGIHSLFSGGDEEPKVKVYTEQKALFQSEYFVKQRLKSPSTADFCYLHESNVQKLNDSTFRVVSCVDSQNGFGAIVRSVYSCKLTYLPSDMVNCEDLVIL